MGRARHHDMRAVVVGRPHGGAGAETDREGAALLLARGHEDAGAHPAPVVTSAALHAGDLRHDVVLGAPAEALR